MRKTFLRTIWLRPGLMIGLVLTALLIGAALVSIVWTPYNPTVMAIAERLKGPSARHWLGTLRYVCASLSIRPQLGFGGCVPTPR